MQHFTAYLRDDDADVFWSATPRPAPAPALYETCHGWGQTTWSAEWAGLKTETTAFVPRHDPLKVVRFRVTNTGAEPRAISLYRYAELALGERREPNAPYVALYGLRARSAPVSSSCSTTTYGALGWRRSPRASSA